MSSLETICSGPVAALTGGELVAVHPLKGDASSRRYYRLETRGGRPVSLVLMQLPPDARPDEVTQATASTELPFVDILRFLAAGGLPVPTLHRFDRDLGLLYLEDLGDVTLESRVSRADAADRRPFYLTAINLLVELQRYGAGRTDGTVAYTRRFDAALLRSELDHFREWLLEADRGVRLAPDERETLDAEFDRIVAELVAAPTTLVHRDFQSRNLMLQGERLRLIDFQDALVGPVAYDLVALLRDSYVSLSEDELDDLIAAYLERAPFPAGPATFRRLFDLQTLQRKLKDAGRFVFIDRVKHNPSFLPSIPASLRYVRDALARLPDRAALAELLARHVPELGSDPVS